jgi:phosphoglucosamine mutase
MVYFGTDGIRGVANITLTHELAFKCGNAVTKMKEKPRVVICKDTRVSGDMILYSLAAGIMCGGGSVINCGILPTPGLAYITRLYNADYGVVISASHNPFEYNGIKIFSSKGCKLSDDEEEKIEEYFSGVFLAGGGDIGTVTGDVNAQDRYADFLFSSCGIDLKGIKVALDCAFGATHAVAPQVFRRLNCEVFELNTDISKGLINDNCGSLHPRNLCKEVKSRAFDIGFAFDGDGDRVIACDEEGNIVDGDKLIYILANQMKSEGRLTGNTVVGTAHTNMGVEKSLSSCGIKMLRADIGDKYVRQLMDLKGCALGGEQSGHIIIGDISTTGDGILTAIQVCRAMVKSGKKLSQLNSAKTFPQININIPVKDKIMVINNKYLQNVIEKCRQTLNKNGRVLVRASGTEPAIRITTECENRAFAKAIAEKIALAVKKII